MRARRRWLSKSAWNSFRLKFGRWPTLGAIVFVLSLGGYLAGVAAQPPIWTTGNSQSTDPKVRDLELTLLARKALFQDNALQSQNFGVTVQNREATLWGTVASTESAQLAEKRLLDVVGLSSVLNELHVQPGDKATERIALGPIHERVPIADPIIPQSQTQVSSVARRPDDSGMMPDMPTTWRPVDGPKLLAIPPQTAQTQVQPAEAARADSATFGPSWRPKSKDARDASLASRPEPQPAVRNLFDTATALRDKDARFIQVKVEVDNGVITLSGQVSREEHIFELAQSVASLQGVSRVVIGQIRTSDRP